MLHVSDVQREDGYRLSAAFTDIDGDAADPGTVTVAVRPPGGTVTTYTYGTDDAVVRDGVGLYHYDVTFTASYTWQFRVRGAGGVNVVEHAEVIVAVDDWDDT